MTGIDEKRGIVHLNEIIPEVGDSVMIVNCGDHFELTQHSWKVAPVPPVHLTDEDIQRLKQGTINWH
jgi:hypothetical protein